VVQSGVATPKPDPQNKQVMLSVWWGVKGTIHSVVLATGYNITTDLYY
jgi:hypothetical protein